MKIQLLILATLLFGFFTQASAHMEAFTHSQNRIVLSASQLESLPNETKSRLFQSANLLAQIWGDTILEGDYYADSDVRIDQVEKVYLGHAFVGYRITYSSKAWDTSTGAFDMNDLKTLDRCVEGRIVESGFLSSDFASMSRDPEAFATFHRK
jgi:hypothetical protein